MQSVSFYHKPYLLILLLHENEDYVITFSIILLTFTLCLIPSPDTHGRSRILLADSEVRAIHCMAIMTSKGAF